MRQATPLCAVRRVSTKATSHQPVIVGIELPGAERASVRVKEIIFCQKHGRVRPNLREPRAAACFDERG